MAFLKNGKYWKIVTIAVNRQLKEATVTTVGFRDKKDADTKKMVQFVPGYPTKVTRLKGDLYPFTNEAAPDQTAQAYCNLRKAEKFFEDAQDV